MSTKTHRIPDARMTAEDIVLAVLGIVAGPLLWWMGQSWQQTAAASSVQTLESWIGLICGFLGLTLCMLWALFAIAGIGLIIGLKTRHQVIAYWAARFTPSFLRRLIVATLGAQLALGSQAVAAPVEHASTSATAVPEDSKPFMPYVVTEPTEQASPIKEPTPAVVSPTAVPTVDAAPTHQAERSAEPRQQSQVIVSPAASSTPSAARPTPTPRETSTITVQPSPDAPAQARPSEQIPQTAPFLPTQPSPSPSIAAPDHARVLDDPTVVVTQGDCLWDIAHHELGADASIVQIDQRWRQWWDYNRAAIGDNPHELHPGTILNAPPFRS